MDHPSASKNDFRDFMAQMRGWTKSLVAGGAAGDHTLTGILTTDHLLYVGNVDIGGDAITDLTSEFTISATNTINNDAGTSSAGGQLEVYWLDQSKGA